MKQTASEPRARDGTLDDGDDDDDDDGDDGDGGDDDHARARTRGRAGTRRRATGAWVEVFFVFCARRETTRGETRDDARGD